jgi:hypothetical protein
VTPGPLSDEGLEQLQEVKAGLDKPGPETTCPHGFAWCVECHDTPVPYRVTEAGERALEPSSAAIYSADQVRDGQGRLIKNRRGPIDPPVPPGPPRCDKPGHTGLTCSSCAAEERDLFAVRDSYTGQMVPAQSVHERLMDLLAQRDGAEAEVTRLQGELVQARRGLRAQGAAPPPPLDPAELRLMVKLLDDERARFANLRAATEHLETIDRARARLAALLEPPAAPAGARP